MFNHDKSHFGYYAVGEYKTFSKIEALEFSDQHGQAMTWHFNDEVYNCYDWSTEPAETIKELYFARARQLREKYDYLVLSYSGGSDSHTVLMSFVEAGVPLDEVVCYTYLEADHRKDSFMNHEIFATALPIVHELKKTNPLYKGLVIRELDISSLTARLFDQVSIFDFQYFANSTISPWNTTKSVIRELTPDYQELCHCRKVGFVHGMEKPNCIKFNKGKFYFQFTDMFDASVGARTQYLNREWEHDEFFFSTPDSPKITIKQCHLIKNFLINSKVPHPWMSNTEASSFGHVPKWHNNQWQTFWLSRLGVNHIIYPWYNPEWITAPKVTNVIFGDRDRWLFEHSELGKPFNTYVNGMMSKYGARWYGPTLHSDKPDVVRFASQAYCLSK